MKKKMMRVLDVKGNLLRYRRENLSVAADCHRRSRRRAMRKSRFGEKPLAGCHFFGAHNASLLGDNE
jgi:hypothetical protein